MAPRPTDTVVISTRLPEGMPERIDKIAGPGNRAAFIREAIERLLDDYEGNPVAYQLERMSSKPDDKWEALLLRWFQDHQEQQQELEAVKEKLDALSDIIVLEMPPGTGRNKFRTAMALELKKHLRNHLVHQKRRRTTSEDDEPLMMELGLPDGSKVRMPDQFWEKLVEWLDHQRRSYEGILQERVAEAAQEWMKENAPSFMAAYLREISESDAAERIEEEAPKRPPRLPRKI